MKINVDETKLVTKVKNGKRGFKGSFDRDGKGIERMAEKEESKCIT